MAHPDHDGPQDIQPGSPEFMHELHVDAEMESRTRSTAFEDRGDHVAASAGALLDDPSDADLEATRSRHGIEASASTMAAFTRPTVEEGLEEELIADPDAMQGLQEEGLLTDE